MAVLETCNFGLNLWKKKLNQNYWNSDYKRSKFHFSSKKKIISFFFSENGVLKEFFKGLIRSYTCYGHTVLFPIDRNFCIWDNAAKVETNRKE